MLLQPVIKWTGSKRSQAATLSTYFPKSIETYYEPFLGGGSMLGFLLKKRWDMKHIIASDLCPELIGMWEMIKTDPTKLIDAYTTHKGMYADLGMEYYYMVRDEFNKTKKPDDFYYLLRMAINGLVRFNSKGEFNSPTDFRRKGMEAKTVKLIVMQWSKLVQKVEFVCQSYDRIFPGKKDFVYMDPPYSQSDGMYTGNIDLPKYFDWVRQLPCKYGISLNGLNMAEANNNDILPSDLYDQRFLLGSGISNFQLIHGKKVKVFEYFYLKSEGYKHRLKIRDLTQFMTTEKSLGNPNQL